jgi:hypothetical protein
MFGKKLGNQYVLPGIFHTFKNPNINSRSLRKKLHKTTSIRILTAPTAQTVFEGIKRPVFPCLEVICVSSK